MKVGDLVQEDTEQDIAIVIHMRGSTSNPISIIVFCIRTGEEEIWSPYHTEVISESR